MAFTFAEKLQKVKTERSNALNQKVSTEVAQAIALEEDEFNDTFLFGDGTNIGIIDLIDYYYVETEELNGNVYDEPNVGSADSV